MSLPKSATEPGSTMPPRSANRAFNLGSASPALISLLGNRRDRKRWIHLHDMWHAVDARNRRNITNEVVVEFFELRTSYLLTYSDRLGAMSAQKQYGTSPVKLERRVHRLADLAERKQLFH